jgi:hypothetical protein
MNINNKRRIKKLLIEIKSCDSFRAARLAKLINRFITKYGI